MREPEEMGYYAIRDEEKMPRAVHAVKARAPKDGIEITKEQAIQISQAYRGERPKRKSPADPEGLAAIVLNEAKDQIIAIVNEASSDRDEAMTLLMHEVKAGDQNLDNRLKAIEHFISNLAQKADDVLGGGQ